MKITNTQKKLIYRKLLKDYMSFFLIALFSSSLIIWVFQAVNFLDIMIEDGRDYLIYINYSLLNFPKILTRLFPFVIFFSLFYVFLRISSPSSKNNFYSYLGIKNRISILVITVLLVAASIFSISKNCLPLLK